MRVRNVVAAALLVVALGLAAEDARADAPLTMAEAVQLALVNNERAQQAPLRVAAADGSVEKARAAFLPTLNAGGTGTKTWPQPRNERDIQLGASITLNVPLLNLTAFPLYSQQKHSRESERWGAAQDVRQLAFDTAKAFLACVAAEQVLDAAKRRLEHAKESTDDTGARATAGLNSTNDVTRAQLEQATSQTQVSSAQANVTNAYLQLSFLVGKPVTGGAVEPTTVTDAAKRKVMKVDDAIAAAIKRRPDIRSAEEKTMSLDESAKEPLYRLAPTLNATGQIRQTIDPLPPDDGRTESIGLTLNWTIYDGGARYGDRKTRLAQADSQRLTERLLKREVATDVNVALTTLRAAREVYEIADAAVATAQRNVDETAILYKQGLARALEVTDANQTRFDAEVTRANAKLSMEQAYLQLRFVLGLDPISTESNAQGAPTGAAPKEEPDQ